MSLFETILNLLRAKRPAIEERVELATKSMEYAKRQALLEKFAPAIRERKKLQATPEMNFDLGKARTNTVIDNKGGEVIFVVGCTGTAKFRFDGVSNPTYLIRAGIMTVPFEKLYLTNTAQAGETLSMIIGQDPSVNFVVDPVTEGLVDIKTAEQSILQEILVELARTFGTTPVISTVDMPGLNTEYSYMIPNGTNKLTLEIGGGGTPFRVSWASDCVAPPTLPYMLINADEKYRLEGVYLTQRLIYFACGVGGQKMIIETVT